MDERPDRGVSVGVTSLAVIFTVLVLTVFAVLSCVTAQNDARLARAYADSVSAWWEADAAAQETASALRAQWEAGADTPALLAAARALGCAAEETERGAAVTYQCPVDAARALRVELALGAEFTIQAWRSVPAEESWQPDDTLELVKGTQE